MEPEAKLSASPNCASKSANSGHSRGLDELKEKIVVLETRNKELEDELAALKKSYHSVDDKRRFYRKKYRAALQGQPKSIPGGKDIFIKKEESDRELSAPESSHQQSHCIKDEPSDDDIDLEQEETQSTGITIGIFRGNPQQQMPNRIEVGMAAPSTLQASPESVVFHDDNNHEAELFILEHLDRVFPLSDTKWSSPGIFLLDHRNIIWLGPEQQHALVLVPKTQSCPRYSLLSPYDSFSGQTREMFIRKKDRLHYTGTYSCGEVPPGMGLVDKDFKGDHGIMTHLMAKSCTEIQTQPEPERLGISEFEVMCEEGNIRAEWIAFRCVGYDGALCDAFSADEGRSSRSHVMKVPRREENSLKRKSFVKEEDEDDDMSMKRVKRSDSL